MQITPAKGNKIGLAQLDAVLGGKANGREAVQQYSDKNICLSNNEMRRPRESYIEKVLRDKDGRLVRATFYVYENAGRLKARLVDFVYLSEEIVKSTKVFLAGFIKTQGSNLNNVIDKLNIFSFINREILFFSGSKPRAPTAH